MGNLYIGTSGWSYNHWFEIFYPPDLANNRMLEYFSSKFDTVELNTSFYGIPQEKTIKKWIRTVPKDFIFTVKGNQMITHRKKLINTKQSLDLFFERINLFKKKLGPILWQLPPSLKPNIERLDQFIKELPKNLMHIFEFRHKDWFNDDIFSFLISKNVSPAIINGLNMPIKTDFNSPVIYNRFHGPGSYYQSKYTEKDLQYWGNIISNYLKDGKKVYAYFNNDAFGYAVDNALYLRNLILGS